MSADEAAALIRNGDDIGMSGFTGSGYPKEFPSALARRMRCASPKRASPCASAYFTGASTGPELDGALAAANAMQICVLPTSPIPAVRKRINDGDMDYIDIHLSHVAQYMEYGFLGKLERGRHRGHGSL